MSVESDGKDASCICDICRVVLATYSTVIADHGGGRDGFGAMQFYFSGSGNHYCPDCMKTIRKAVDLNHPWCPIRSGP
jgi:hypothetical protein